MSDNFLLLLFIIFFVIPLIERVLKGGQQQKKPPPPQRRPRPELDDEAHGERGMTAGQPRRVPSAHERAPDAVPDVTAYETGDPAADMIPDDVWEILTGERRQRPAPAPPPPEQWERARPRRHAEPWTDDAEAWADEAETEAVMDAAVVEAARADIERVERETRARIARQERAAARRVTDELRVVESVRRSGRRFGSSLLDVKDRDALRRAFVLREVLGPPKALE